MKIDIDGEYGIKSDSRQFILGEWKKRKNKETGDKEEYLSAVAYCGHLSSALHQYKKRALLKSDSKTLNALKCKLEEVEEKIDQISEKLGG